MHIYNKLSENLQKKVDFYIKRNNKFLTRMLHNDLIIYNFKKNVNWCLSSVKSLSWSGGMCSIC